MQPQRRNVIDSHFSIYRPSLRRKMFILAPAWAILLLLQGQEMNKTRARRRPTIDSHLGVGHLGDLQRTYIKEV